MGKLPPTLSRTQLRAPIGGVLLDGEKEVEGGTEVREGRKEKRTERTGTNCKVLLLMSTSINIVVATASGPRDE